MTTTILLDEARAKREAEHAKLPQRVKGRRKTTHPCLTLECPSPHTNVPWPGCPVCGSDPSRIGAEYPLGWSLQRLTSEWAALRRKLG